MKDSGVLVDGENATPPLVVISGKSMENILCKIFGHLVEELSVGLAQAKCGRCKRTFHVHYDMTYGDTIFDEEVTPTKTDKTTEV